MSEDTPTLPSSSLARDCRRLARIVAVVGVVLALLMALETLGPWLVRPPGCRTAVGGVIDLAAPLAYLAALWRLGRALNLFAESGRFVDTAASALKGVGLALVVGGLLQAVVGPTLRQLIGAGPGYFIALDFPAVVTVALGLSLWAFARLFRRAARLEAELDGIL